MAVVHYSAVVMSAGLTTVFIHMLICLFFFIMHPDLVLIISPSCVVGLFPLTLSVPVSVLMPTFLVDCSMFSASC